MSGRACNSNPAEFNLFVHQNWRQNFRKGLLRLDWRAGSPDLSSPHEHDTWFEVLQRQDSVSFDFYGWGYSMQLHIYSLLWILTTTINFFNMRKSSGTLRGGSCGPTHRKHHQEWFEEHSWDIPRQWPGPKSSQTVADSGYLHFRANDEFNLYKQMWMIKQTCQLSDYWHAHRPVEPLTGSLHKSPLV